MDSRVSTAAEAQAILTRTLTPRSPGGIKIPLYLPAVTTKWARDPFSLDLHQHHRRRGPGASVRNDNAPTLTRKALDARRDDAGEAHVVISDLSEDVVASQMAHSLR